MILSPRCDGKAQVRAVLQHRTHARHLAHNMVPKTRINIRPALEVLALPALVAVTASRSVKTLRGSCSFKRVVAREACTSPQSFPVDPRVAQLDDDPRCQPGAELGKAQRAARGETGLRGRNSASFDPTSTLIRPAMRVAFGSPGQRYDKILRHDDVVIVPGFYGGENDWHVYYELISEMRELQAKGIKDSSWKSWHEGAHLLSPNPEGSKTYRKVLDRMCEYFEIAPGTRGIRFNWYRDGRDWKPFHHDSAAFNAQRARNQNCTVGISFGSARELAFKHARSGELVYFPQNNGMLYFFGRDVNIRWQHAVNAQRRGEEDAEGRISIILWGLCTRVVDEPGSPPLLTDGQRSFDMGSRRNKTVCRDFLRGCCRYGDRCRFSHSVDSDLRTAKEASAPRLSSCQRDSAPVYILLAYCTS